MCGHHGQVVCTETTHHAVICNPSFPVWEVKAWAALGSAGIFTRSLTPPVSSIALHSEKQVYITCMLCLHAPLRIATGVSCPFVALTALPRAAG